MKIEKVYTVTEDKEVYLNGERYLLEKGDKIIIQEGFLGDAWSLIKDSTVGWIKDWMLNVSSLSWARVQKKLLNLQKNGVEIPPEILDPPEGVDGRARAAKWLKKNQATVAKVENNLKNKFGSLINKAKEYGIDVPDGDTTEERFIELKKLVAAHEAKGKEGSSEKRADDLEADSKAADPEAGSGISQEEIDALLGGDEPDDEPDAEPAGDTPGSKLAPDADKAKAEAQERQRKLAMGESKKSRRPLVESRIRTFVRRTASIGA